MKILQLGKFYPIRGGVEKVMWDITRGLCARGVDCDMLCAYDKASMKEADVRPQDGEIVFNGHGRCICVPALAKLAATMISPSMIFRLRRICRDYDVIHVHHPDPMAALALRLSGYRGRVILHWHSDILKQKFFLTFYRPLQNWLIRRTDLVVGTTPVYVRESPCLAAVQHKVAYVPIGIEKLSVNQQKVVSLQDIVRGRRVVFSLGRLVEYKGYESLIDAAAFLPEDYLTVIGGAGPLRESLQARIDKAGLGDRVLLAGYLEDDVAHAWMEICKVFVLSSVMKTEAFGIVQIEAMSLGKPVVATRIPGSGTSWVNEDGVSGLNVPVRDAKAIAQAVMDICSDEERYAEYVKGAAGRYERLFTLDGMIDNLMDIYE